MMVCCNQNDFGSTDSAAFSQIAGHDEEENKNSLLTVFKFFGTISLFSRKEMLRWLHQQAGQRAHKSQADPCMWYNFIELIPGYTLFG